MRTINGGFLINLEGEEGCGKSSQLPYLVEFLRDKGFVVYPTREPGGTSIGEQIRDVLHDTKNVEMHPRTEALLYQSARAQIVEQVIRPRLARGEIVICDRFYDSTIAYQGFGHQQNISNLNELITFATDGLEPDLTVLLDVDVEVGLARKSKSDEWNRMDAMSEAFHRRAYEGYLKMAQIDARWVVVNANNGIEEVRQELIREVSNRLWYRGMIEGFYVGKESRG